MKRYIALFFSLCAILPLAGCAGSSTSSSSDISLPPASLLVMEDSNEESPQGSAPALGDPHQTTAEELITRAMEIYGWFALGGMPLSENSRTLMNPATQREDFYQQVDSPYFSTYAQMKEYLSHYFSADIVKSLVDEYPMFQEVDGILYMIPAGRGADIFVESVAFSTDEVSDTMAKLSATVTYAAESGEKENPKVFSFTYEKINGEWVFTTFPYYL